MDWMLIAASTAFFALCALCAYAVNAQSEPAPK